MEDRKEGPLSRWSRLKRETAAAENAGKSGNKSGNMPAAPMAIAKARPVDATAASQAASGAGPSRAAPQKAAAATQPLQKEPEPARIEDLPDVDTLTYKSDFTVFLRKGIPAVLQSAALAKLWRSDPVLANLDGLNDYEDDFRVITDVDSPLRKLFEPESPAELALEREERLPRRDAAEPAPEPPQEQPVSGKADAAEAAPEQDGAPGKSEAHSEEA